LKINDKTSKTNRNEPKNEAYKLLKTLDGLKNELKNEPTDVIENKRRLKNELKTNRRKFNPNVAHSGHFPASRKTKHQPSGGIETLKDR
jgi:hypothetical protein